eukprot:Hpha_TRINITY_DN11893_c0_g1::TRINITY_DN11893_c0_g1_i1::g.2007::m.2007
MALAAEMRFRAPSPRSPGARDSLRYLSAKALGNTSLAPGTHNTQGELRLKGGVVSEEALNHTLGSMLDPEAPLHRSDPLDALCHQLDASFLGGSLAPTRLPAPFRSPATASSRRGPHLTTLSALRAAPTRAADIGAGISASGLQWKNRERSIRGAELRMVIGPNGKARFFRSDGGTVERPMDRRSAQALNSGAADRRLRYRHPLLAQNEAAASPRNPMRAALHGTFR